MLKSKIMCIVWTILSVAGFFAGFYTREDCFIYLSMFCIVLCYLEHICGYLDDDGDDDYM